MCISQQCYANRYEVSDIVFLELEDFSATVLLKALLALTEGEPIEDSQNSMWFT